jgi:glycosyltransferase involved in cell wall biosynthesis
MGKPTVDIVVPVYNGAQHLRECLESILGQTYESWRAVVVNNCSTDDTGRIADEYAQRDCRFRVVHCTEFLGQTANYNRAVAQSSNLAEYVKVLEADNWITEDSISKMVEVAEKDKDIGIVGCYC